MEAARSLPYSQQTATRTHPQPEQSTPCPSLLVLENPLHITLPSMPGSSKWSPPFTFLHQNPVHLKPCSTSSQVTTIFLNTLYNLSPAAQAPRLQQSASTPCISTETRVMLHVPPLESQQLSQWRTGSIGHPTAGANPSFHSFFHFVPNTALFAVITTCSHGCKKQTVRQQLQVNTTNKRR